MAAPGVWTTPGAQPVREATGLHRLLPVLVSVWIDLDRRGRAVVAGERFRTGVAGRPDGVDAFSLFGPVLLAASGPCSGCGSSSLLALGVRGGERVFSYVHHGQDTARLVPFHLALEIGGVPDAGLARPAGLVLGAVAGELGVPVQVERMLWAGEDGRPIGWSRIPTEVGGGRHHALRESAGRFFAFDRSGALTERQRWLWLDSDQHDRELLRSRLDPDYDGIAVQRLHAAEGQTLRDLELIG